MDATARIEMALDGALARAAAPGAPPLLAEAMRYAVFPGGARVRPRLCLAVTKVCGDNRPQVAGAAAAAIELLHCASLVHDDLPCFDDAPHRRGKPSVHHAFGERLAVLAGDALIVLAFEQLSRGAVLAPDRLGSLLAIICRSLGAPAGIMAGQAWECEPHVELAAYHRAKTGALFAAATEAGAAAAGVAPDAWRTLGELIGEAYQVADDIRDMSASPDEIGKPCGRDLALDRPSAVRKLGLGGAKARLEGLLTRAMEAIPACSGAAELRAEIALEAMRFLPKEVSRRAA